MFEGEPDLGFAKREKIMFYSLNPVRQAAVSLAGALIASLLFVSAAIGPLPIV